jgi:hypothetical protein
MFAPITDADRPGTEVVGRCLYCRAPWDEFKPDDVCCVCRELVLACAECRPKHGELHCEDHQQVSRTPVT